MTISILISGATGRVGRALVELASRDAECRVVGADASESSGNQVISTDPPVTLNAAPIAKPDVVIDFSTDAGARRAAASAVAHSAALVVATTGLSGATRDALDEAATKIPIIEAANTSLGATLLASLAAGATRALGPTYDISIVEAHRAGKRDAPSGTALRIARAIRDAGGRLADHQILSIRGGDAVGEHTVRFSGLGETIELTHRAADRRLFAAGALRAARWLVGKPAGRYTIEESLGL